MGKTMRLTKYALLTTSVLALTSAVTFAADKAIQAEFKPVAEVHWGFLNPLRGDKSPAAANLWGDRSKNGATGMLVRFQKGFSSPHIFITSLTAVL